jgi:hypothetical protein
VAFHVALREQREVRERHDAPAFDAADAGLRTGKRTCARFVDADRERHVGYAGGHFERGQPERGGSGGRCILDLLHRNAGTAEVAQHRARGRHAEQRGAVIHRFDGGPVDARVAQCFAHGGETQHRIRRFGHPLIRMQPDTDDVCRTKCG